VTKKAQKDSQTVFVAVRIEDPARPAYKIENRSTDFWLEYFQAGTGEGPSGLREGLAPGQSAPYSWADPERAKGKRLLCCHLGLLSQSDAPPDTVHRLEIELDGAE
jgi:hypothetical protein